MFRIRTSVQMTIEDAVIIEVLAIKRFRGVKLRVTLVNNRVMERWYKSGDVVHHTITMSNNASR